MAATLPVGADPTKGYPNDYQISIGIAGWNSLGQPLNPNGTLWISPTTGLPGVPIGYSGGPIQPAAGLGVAPSPTPIASPLPAGYTVPNGAVAPVTVNAPPPKMAFSVPGYAMDKIPVGAGWTLTFANLQANAAVTVDASVNGAALGSVTLGTTDANGSLQVSGTVPNIPGVWHETYSQNGAVFGTVDFTVLASAAASSPTQTVATPNSPAAGTQTQSNQTPSTVPNGTFGPDSRGTGYGTLPGGTGNAAINFTVGYPLNNIPGGVPWVVDISGIPAGAPVSVAALVNGRLLPPSQVGVADANGRLHLTGTIPTNGAGPWLEVWTYVDPATGQQGNIGRLSFIVTTGTPFTGGQALPQPQPLVGVGQGSAAPAAKSTGILALIGAALLVFRR